MTFLDAYNGRLFYRSQEISDLAQDHDFEDVAYYMIFGSMPSRSEKKDFLQRFAEAAVSLAPEMRKAIQAIP